MPTPALPHDWLAQAARQWPDTVFLEDEGISLTFAEGLARVEALAGWMRAQGVEKGARVLVCAPNRIELPLIAFAALRLGALFSLLSPQLQPAGLARILAQCEPALVLLDAPTAHLRETAATSTARVHLLEEIPATGPGAPPAALTPADAAFLVFTSGSTGTPRGVILTHGNVAFVAPVIQARLGYEKGDCIGVFLPLSFDYALYQMFYACLAGATLSLARPEMAGPELPGVLARRGITVLPGVPTLFAALLKMQRHRPRPLPALRMFTNTGDHLPQAHISQLRELFPRARVFPMYGLTECKRVSILLPEELDAQPASVGRPLDGTTVFAVDAEGRRLPPGELGELVIQGPHLSPGYWRAPEETAKRFRHLDGVPTLFSGDQGRVDEAGFITFHSRDDFLIKHRGTRLNPAEVEDAACALPGITGAGCVKDEPRGLLRLYLTTQGAPPAAAGVLSALATMLEQAKLPDRIHPIPELPRTANQKLDRKALRALAEAEA